MGPSNELKIFRLRTTLNGNSRDEVIKNLTRALRSNQWHLHLIDEQLGILSATRSDTNSIAPLSISIVEQQNLFTVELNYSEQRQEQSDVAAALCNIVSSSQTQL